MGDTWQRRDTKAKETADCGRIQLRIWVRRNGWFQRIRKKSSLQFPVVISLERRLCHLVSQQHATSLLHEGAAMKPAEQRIHVSASRKRGTFCENDTKRVFIYQEQDAVYIQNNCKAHVVNFATST